MAKLTFRGGVKLSVGKELTRDLPIKTLFSKEEMVYSLCQHMGKPAIPTVSVGDRVLTGQRIAEADGEESANVHASVSGEITAIEERTMADGAKAPCIILRNDGRFDEIIYPEKRHVHSLHSNTILTAIREAGIVGLGGSGIPTALKLSQPDPMNIEFVIADAIESEPYLTSDYRRLTENPMKVINGLRILLRLYPRARGILALSERDGELYERLRHLLRDDPHIAVRRLRDKYPQGEERLLVECLTERTMGPGMTPADMGCIVHNIDTLVAINQAVIVHEPLLTRLITVSGDAFRAPQNFRVRIGTPYRELIRAAGLIGEPALMLDGGPMRGQVLADQDAPITKLSTAILAFRRDPRPTLQATPCFRCGRCYETCPEGLMPSLLHEAASKDLRPRFLELGGDLCQGCGACSYICPAQIHLSEEIFAAVERYGADSGERGIR